MKVPIDWLKELVDLKVTVEELVRLLPLRTVGLKEITPNYIELDMKGYNRADLLSLRGVAFEVAAITASKIKSREKEDFLWERTDLPKANVVVENENLAPLYCIARIENLKVEHSTDTWVKKLNNSGIRTVNNVADITNLIMVEYGQPMHAFDAAQVTNETIIVRTAKPGEILTTLDEKVRALSPKDLLITDPKKALGLAGMMGGKNSEVSESTSTILLEAAIFDPKTLRKTATKLGLISEASKRFYYGLTKKRLFQALDSAIKMYEEIGGKLTALTIVDHLNQQTITLKLTQQKINSLIGVEISPKQVEDYLTALGFKLSQKHLEGEEMRLHLRGGINWDITVPYWRLDINIEEDLIEEVARMYGYEKIPAKPLDTSTPNSSPNPIFGLLEDLKQALSKLGLTEVQTYSYYSTQTISNVKCQMSNLIKIANPISSETEYLRDSLWPNLVEVVTKNIKNGFKDIAIFEVGKTYLQEDGLPKEQYKLAIALSNNSNNPTSKLYQIVRNLSMLRFNLNQGLILTNSKYFHPTRFVSLEKAGKPIGFTAEVHPRIVNKFGVEQRVAVLEMEITKLL